MNISTAENPSPFDPLDRMPPDEPRFVIRGADPAGPPTITEWARHRRNIAFKTYGTEPVGEAMRLLEAELVQCAEAEAMAMEWKERQVGGAPLEGARATYANAVISEEQVAAARRQKLVSDLRAHLREADYLIHELLEIDGASVSLELVAQAARVHALVEEIA